MDKLQRQIGAKDVDKREEEENTDPPADPVEISADREVQVYADELKMMKDRLHCAKCKTQKVGCIILPCGHVVLCKECGDRMDNVNCWDCGVKVAATADIYLA